MTLLLAGAVAADPIVNPHDLFFVRREATYAAVVDQPYTYDYQPSAIRNADGTKDIYYCGGELVYPAPPALPYYKGHDAVFHAKLAADNTPIGSITKVIAASEDKGEADGVHACDVAVIRHSHPGLKWPGGTNTGQELLFLYYECAPYMTDRAAPSRDRLVGPAELCLAASADNGATWMKHSSALTGGNTFGTLATVPTAVVAKNPVVAEDLCDWEEAGGEFLADVAPAGTDPFLFQLCDDYRVAYASGHPTAISMPKAGGGREVWLFYYDSAGHWDDRGLRLVKSDDGIHFGAPIDLWAIDPETGEILNNGLGHDWRFVGGKVTYIDQPVAGHPGVFVASGPNNYLSYFGYSFDGVHWVSPWYGYASPEPLLRLAEARSDDQDPGRDRCMLNGSAGILADKYGWVNRFTSLEFFSGEGQRGIADPAWCYNPNEDGPGFAKTWGIYTFKGDFGQILRATDDPCTHWSGQTVRNQNQRLEPLGPHSQLLWMWNGKKYSYLDYSDFLAKNGGNPIAYVDISNGSFADVAACPFGGTRPMPVTANADSATVAQGMAVKIGVLANDTGAFDSATLNQVGPPSYGKLSIAGGSITYTHHPGDSHTSDSFTYKVNDTSGYPSNTATVTVTLVTPTVLHRVNAGGPALPGGWLEDRAWTAGGIPSSRVNSVAIGDYIWTTTTVDTSDSSIPAGTPADLFKDERFDVPASPSMLWSFPANAGQMVEARLYFSENYLNAAGRVFTVQAEGANCPDITSFDIWVAAGNTRYKGIMRSCKVFVGADGKLDLNFVNILDGPTVHGIEILGRPLVNPVPTVSTRSLIAASGLGTVTTLATSPSTAQIVNAPSIGNSAAVTSGVATYLNGAGGAAGSTDRFSYTVTSSAGVVSEAGLVNVAIKAKSLLYRVNAGGAAVTQSGGNWLADSALSPSIYANTAISGNNVYAVSGPITADATASSANPDIFKSCRIDLPTGANLIYSFTIGAGAGPQVEVKLYFAEIYHAAKNLRKFDVKLEGALWLDEFDIFAEAGALGTMRSKAQSTDGTLNVELAPGGADAAQVNGIEIYGPLP